MTKHIISILTLAVVSLIAGLTLLFDTRTAGQLTDFGYSVLGLTALSFVLGVAAEVHTIREDQREKLAERAKESAEREQFGRLESEVRASTKPLMPIRMFCTLRHTIDPAAAERSFGTVEGYKTQKSDLLRLVGSARLGGPLGYNSVDATASESHCILDGDRLAEEIRSHTGFGKSAIREPVGCSVELYVPASGVLPSEPTVTLTRAFGRGKPDDVKRLELFDNVVYQDSFIREWSTSSDAARSLSVADLYDARIRVQWQFLGEQGPVALHDLQLFFGPVDMMWGIRFPEKDVQAAAFMTDPAPILHPSNELAAQLFAPYLLEYECTLTKDLFAEHFFRIMS